jgi:hypothetical protein
MRPIRKRNIVALGAATMLLVGAGSAVAASQSGPPSFVTHVFGQNGPGHGVMAGGVVMDAAAEYIGISETALATERHDGKSLAQIAVAHGKTAAGLESALVAAFKANLDKLVSAGTITSSQATQALATFQSQVQTVINRTATGPLNGRGAGMGLGLGQGPGMGQGQGQGMGQGMGACRR